MIDLVSMWLEQMPLDCACWIITLAAICLDVIAGTTKAIITKTVSSEKARAGVLHKSGFILAMLLCTYIDITQHIIDIGFSVPVLAGCTVMIVTCEIFSVCEHVKECVPEIKLSFLEKSDNDQKGH